MRILSDTYALVRQSILAACGGRDPSEWADAVAAAFPTLQSQGFVSSWSAGPYMAGLVIHVTVPGQDPADIFVLPRAGQRIGAI
jgi:hypothetical protein